MGVGSFMGGEPEIFNFENLNVYKKALEFINLVYCVTNGFPSEERFALTDQFRRAAYSIALNIAEGYGRYTFPDKAAKYVIARGECTETEAHIRIAIALGFITDDEAASVINRIYFERRLLSGLISACRKRGQ